MSYLALARKWRPRTFSQLVGQEHINKALINALNQQRLHHAYLFTGTRGVGKTSIARILAKSLNCEKGISSEPCLQCNACTAIEQGRFIDLIEIDGASKTRVEDTRDLLDNVQYAPTNGRFKIYLIDEVHMLSQHSFNALLKTLEEPPAHVKFILATTDPQKLPITVLSRCLQFNLKHLATESISKHLQFILQEEQLDFENQAVDILAQAARGSMRDALSLLDQAITSCDNRLLASDVKMLLGYTQQDYALQLLEALSAKNAQEIFLISQRITVDGGHFQYVLDEILHYLHQVALYQAIGEGNNLITPSQEIITLSQKLSAEDTQLFYQIGLMGREEIHLAPELAIGFNMTLLRMLAFRPAPQPTGVSQINLIATPPSPIQSPPLPLPEELTGLPIPEEKIPSQNDEVLPTIAKTFENHNINEAIESKPVKTEGENQSWGSIITQLKLTGLALNAAENAELIARNGREVILRVSRGHQSLFTPTILSRIEEALEKYYQSPVKIKLTSDQAVQASPAIQKEHANQQKQHNAEIALQNDPVFQQIQQQFSAELVKNSIVPLKDDL